MILISKIRNWGCKIGKTDLEKFIFWVRVTVGKTNQCVLLTADAIDVSWTSSDLRRICCDPKVTTTKIKKLNDSFLCTS